jgi:hypothetical protein
MIPLFITLVGIQVGLLIGQIVAHARDRHELAGLLLTINWVFSAIILLLLVVFR